MSSDESASLGLPDFPIDNIPKIAALLGKFPSARVFELFNRLYPYESFLQKEGREGVEHVLKSFQVKKNRIATSENSLLEVKFSSDDDSVATCSVSLNSTNLNVKVMREWEHEGVREKGFLSLGLK